jgi:hypothetical protein
VTHMISRKAVQIRLVHLCTQNQRRKAFRVTACVPWSQDGKPNTPDFKPLQGRKLHDAD